MSGSRWRCPSCELFVSVASLELCELTAHILKEFENAASTEKDRVEYCSDGTYKLLEQRINQRKRKCGPTTTAASKTTQQIIVIDQELTPKKQKVARKQEVIEID